MESIKAYDEILTEMQAEYESLTGAPVDEASDIGIRLRVLAEQLEILYARLEEVRGQVFPQTSTGKWLDRHAQCRGLIRKAAQPSAGVLRFSRENPAVADIPIVKGSVCATRPTPQLQFVTTEDAVLPAGGTWVDVPAAAESPGAESNVAASAVCLMVSSVPGVTSVKNPDPFAGGTDEESDSELRSRLLDAYRSISNGTNRAFYYDIAMQQEGVRSVNVVPRARGRGTVDVVVDGVSTQAQNAAVAAIQERLDQEKEINVDVQVKGASKLGCSIVFSVSALESYNSGEVLSNCSKAVMAYLSALPVGQPLLVARMYELLMAQEGVANAKVTAPGTDIYPDGYRKVSIGSLSTGLLEVAG